MKDSHFVKRIKRKSKKYLSCVYLCASGHLHISGNSYVEDAQVHVPPNTVLFGPFDREIEGQKMLIKYLRELREKTIKVEEQLSKQVESYRDNVIYMFERKS